MQTPAKGQDSNQAPKKKKKKKKRAIQTGRVNRLQITEAPTGIPIMTGMFFAHGHPDIVFFDSGASHSFISSLFIVRIDRNDLKIESTNDIWQLKPPARRTQI